MVLGGLVGATSSFVIFLPPMNEFLSLIIRLVTAFAVVFATFFPTSRKSFLKAVSAYFLITFCFCGACIAFFMLFSPPVAIRNGAVYIDISPIMLVGIILACYIIIRIICRVSGRSLASQEICWLVVENNEKSVKLIAKTDTGNMLKEPFSNLPVIVAEREKLEVVLPSEISDYLAKTVSVSDTSCDYVSGIRLVPYNSVGGEGLLPAFKPDSIKIILNGKTLEIESPDDAIKNKIALLTEERRATGIFAGLSVQENACIANLDAYKKHGLLSDKKMRKDTEWVIESMRVKTPSAKAAIKNLSGGNQQKVILGRWLLTDPQVLLLDEPTRGIDVGAKYEIYELILDLAKQGRGVIMVSSEMPEIMGVCDRIIVMSGGRIAGEVDGKNCTQEQIMGLAAKYA